MFSLDVFPETITWTVIDIAVGCIVASLPALNIMVDWIWPKSWSTRKRNFSSLYKGSGSGTSGSGSNNRSRRGAGVSGATTSTGSTDSTVEEEKSGAHAHGEPVYSPNGITRRDEVELGYGPAEKDGATVTRGAVVPESLTPGDKKPAPGSQSWFDSQRR